VGTAVPAKSGWLGLIMSIHDLPWSERAELLKSEHLLQATPKKPAPTHQQPTLVQPTTLRASLT